MLYDIFTRIFMALSSFGSPSGPDGALPSLPSNLSLTKYIENWINNETVFLDNPNILYENGKVSDEENNWMITLPLCSGFTDSEGLILGNSDNGSIVEEDKMGYWYPAPHVFPSENKSHYMFTVRKPACSAPLKPIRLEMDEYEVFGTQGRFLRNGYYGYNDMEFYSPQEYCINALTVEFAQVHLCESQEADCSTNPTDNTRPPCIQKCCNPDEIYSFTRRACVKSSTGALFHPPFYHDLSSKLGSSEQQSILPHYHIKFPRFFKYFCEENRTQIFPAGHNFAEHLTNFTQRKYHSAQFKIRTDGKIMYRKDGKAVVMEDQDRPIYLKEQNKKCHTLKPTAFYCIDGAAEFGSSSPFNNDEGEMFLVTCSEYLFDPPKIGPLSSVYGNVMITSSVFSLLTVVVYSILKEKQNIHGWTIASYAMSMFFMYIFLGLAHLIRYYGSDDVLKTASCVTVGIASHLFSLASFMWLFLINWDIWWTFRNIRPTRTTTNQHQRNKNIRQFLIYCVVGWGIPIVILGVTTFLHFKYEDAAENNCAIVKAPLPAYGRESCEIKQLSLGVYLYFPATFLLGCNLVFFIITMYTLCSHSIKTHLATKSLERHRQSFQLFAKLFFVMGVTRVFEVITWAGSGPTLTWYWAVFDIFNVLQAVAIFIVYVCKRDVLIALRELFFLRFYGKDQGGDKRNSEKHTSGWNSQCHSKTSTLDSSKSGKSAFSSMMRMSNVSSAPLKPMTGSDETLIICSADLHQQK